MRPTFGAASVLLQYEMIKQIWGTVLALETIFLYHCYATFLIKVKGYLKVNSTTLILYSTVNLRFSCALNEMGYCIVKRKEVP